MEGGRRKPRTPHQGRQLADRLGIKLEAVVAGDNLKEIEKQILPFGVDTLYKFEDKRLYPYTSLPHASLLINLFKEKEPRIAFMGATSIGRDLRTARLLFASQRTDGGLHIARNRRPYRRAQR